jgi:hypothetical protein
VDFEDHMKVTKYNYARSVLADLLALLAYCLVLGFVCLSILNGFMINSREE